MKNLIIAIVSAAVGAGIAHFVTKNKMNKKMDALAAKASGDMAAMNKQLEAMHNEFVKNVPTDIAAERQKKWDAIKEEINNPKPSDSSLFDISDTKAAEDFRNKQISAMNAKLNPYCPPKSLQTFVEITQDEYENPNDTTYSKEQLAFYMSTDSLYDEYTRRVDDSVTRIGLSETQLASRAARYYGITSMYIRNNETLEDFEITYFGEDCQDPLEATL